MGLEHGRRRKSSRKHRKDETFFWKSEASLIACAAAGTWVESCHCWTTLSSHMGERCDPTLSRQEKLVVDRGLSETSFYSLELLQLAHHLSSTSSLCR